MTVVVDLADEGRSTGPMAWISQQFCTDAIHSALQDGRPEGDVVALMYSRFSEFRSGTECPRCGMFDMHWIEEIQNHVAVIRTCRNEDCAFRWEQQ